MHSYVTRTIKDKESMISEMKATWSGTMKGWIEEERDEGNDVIMF